MDFRIAIEEAAAAFERLEPLFLADIKPEKAVLVVIDMINGFAVEGALASPRVGALIPVVSELARKCDQKGIGKIALTDRHSNASAEFADYPPHCIAGTTEAEPVPELRAIGGFIRINKNSTNGFLEEEFLRFLGAHPGVDTFILAGDCTDLCVLQFALTLKAHFNRLNMASRIIVPKNAVDTYDAPGHSAGLANIMAFSNMRLNGVEIVSKII